MTRSEVLPVDMETLAAQLREYVIEPLHSPGLVKAMQYAVGACNDAVALIQAEERRRRHPRITDNLPSLHRRYRRKL